MSADKELRINELRKAVRESPGSPEWFELAETLSTASGGGGGDEKKRSEARELCFRALREDPRHFRGRLLLAKLFYLDQMPEFCVRELIELKRLGASSPSLVRLLDAFGTLAERYGSETAVAQSPEAEVPSASEPASGEEAVVAEIDLDAEFADVLSELDE